MLVHYETLVNSFKDQHIPKGLCNREQNVSKHFWNNPTCVETPLRPWWMVMFILCIQVYYWSVFGTNVQIVIYFLTEKKSQKCLLTPEPQPANHGKLPEVETVRELRPDGVTSLGHIQHTCRIINLCYSLYNTYFGCLTFFVPSLLVHETPTVHIFVLLTQTQNTHNKQMHANTG